jgi:hypothetical protein
MSRQRLLQVIIRDDDVSALTSIEQLSQLYAPLWRRSQPVCIFVVPLASSQIFEARPTMSFAATHPLSGNRDLCVFLKRAILSNCVEVGLHGLRHGPEEFDIPDPAVVVELTDEAEALVKSVIPDASLKTFVPPRENMSITARDTLLKKGFNICSKSTTLWPSSRLRWWLFRLRRWVGWPGFHNPVSHDGTRWLFPCDEYLFTSDRSPEQCLRRARRMASYCRQRERPLICVNHHWEFFGPGGIALRHVWHTFLSELLQRDDVQFTTFNTYSANCPAELGRARCH